jgi:ABC-type nitrate/sulfonate/bicarbonate transport system permease component
MLDFIWLIDWIQLFSNCFASVRKVLIGVLCALIVGVLLGLVRSYLPKRLKKNKALNFVLEAPKFPPPIAWIPFVVIFCGIGEIAASIVVFIGAFSPIFTNTYEGAEGIPQPIRDIAKSLEVKGWRFLWEIALPATLPQIFIGLRSGTGMGWMAIIAAEMISGQSGLGYSIQMNRLMLQYDLMTVDMIMIGIIGFLLFQGIIFLEKVIIPWKYVLSEIRQGGR